MDSLIKEMEREHDPYEEVKTWPLKDFLSKFYKIEFGYDYYSVTGGGEKSIRFYGINNLQIIVYNLSGITFDDIRQNAAEFIVEQMKSGHYHLRHMQKELCPGVFLVKKDGFWGCTDSVGKVIIPIQYDVISLSVWDDEKILCGRNGTLYTGYETKCFVDGVNNFVSVYTGVYDLYNKGGKIVLGGFIDYKYFKECKMFVFQFGINRSLRAGNGTKTSPYRFKGPYGSWMLFDSRYRINGKNRTVEGTIFNIKKGYLHGTSIYETISDTTIKKDDLYEEIQLVNSTTFLCKWKWKYIIIYLSSKYCETILSSEYEWIDVLDELYAIVYSKGKIGLLRNGRTAIPCDYSYITRPIGGWCFAAIKYPYTPNSKTWHNYYVIFCNVEKNRYDCISYEDIIVAIDNIDYNTLQDVLYFGGLKLFKRDESMEMSSYTISEKYKSFFRADFLQRLSPVLERNVHSGCYWESAESIRYSLKRKNNVAEFYDSYSLMDALDGDPSAYWNID